MKVMQLSGDFALMPLMLWINTAERESVMTLIPGVWMEIVVYCGIVGRLDNTPESGMLVTSLGLPVTYQSKPM